MYRCDLQIASEIPSGASSAVFENFVEVKII